MQMTPALKGQIARFVKSSGSQFSNKALAVREFFSLKGMPREQAKHAAKKYLAA